MFINNIKRILLSNSNGNQYTINKEITVVLEAGHGKEKLIHYE